MVPLVILGLCVIIPCVCLGSLLLVLHLARNAPLGHESDEHGFVLDRPCSDQDQEQAPVCGDISDSKGLSLSPVPDRKG